MTRIPAAAWRTAPMLALSIAFAATTVDRSHAQGNDTEAIRREMQDMRRQYDAMFQRMRRDYEGRIAALESRLKTAQSSTGRPPPSTATAPQPITIGIQTEPAPAPTPVRPAAAPASTASAFNPAIGVVLDGKLTSYSKDPASYRLRGFALGRDAGLDPRGLGLGESEINFSANVDQWLYGSLTISVAREGDVDVEEAFVQTTSLPGGFTAKAGRFFSSIGYLNELHAHVWDFADAPLPYRAFLNNQYRDDGVQLRWLAPTDIFVELGAEAFRGDSFPAGGAANRGIGSWAAFGHVGADIGASHSFRAGLSWLRTDARNRETTSEFGTDSFTGRGDTAILDVVYKWAPDGNPTQRNLKLQGEYFVRRERGLFNATDYRGTQQGWYAQGVYQFMPRWRVGLRYDSVHARAPDAPLAGTALDPLGATPRRYSAMLDYSTSEFGRFRLQYNLDESRPQTDHQFLLQYTVSIGAHGAHRY